VASLIWTPEARSWLQDIHQYIARDSPASAYKVVRGIFDKANLLLETPEIGYRPDTRKYPGVRIVLYGHYRIAYVQQPNGDIGILGVFHGALDLKRHLRRP